MRRSGSAVILATHAIPALVLSAGLSAAAADDIGLAPLRAAVSNLFGEGIRVAQVEAPFGNALPPPFQVNPAVVGQPASKFKYFTGPPTEEAAESSSAFPNAFGQSSGHAHAVAGYFYGPLIGISTNVANVDNYEATYFFETLVVGLDAIDSKIVNQTFVVPGSAEEQRAWDSRYDDYAAIHNTLFISGIGNGGPIYAPASSYNGIGAGAIGGASSVGPAFDGRAKPDLVAPAQVTSYSTPRVAGAATLLLQAALRGDGGDTNRAADSRTLKALLMNGAVKPNGWTALSPSPLDRRHGAGVLNVFNSYMQLEGGRHTFVESRPVNILPVPIASSTSLSSLRGWDLNGITNSTASDQVNHYYFEVPSGAATHSGTATLVWHRQQGQTNINNLDLALYSMDSGALVASSTSVVDNVEHVFVPALPAGRYDLQVIKRDGLAVSETETYAVAFEFVRLLVSLKANSQGVSLTWPDYPSGYVLQSAANVGGTWTNVGSAATLHDRTYRLDLPASEASRFFRLIR
ncbi:MAG TPA: S8 family serine peptidase [Verrucomicrobiae bacterium]|nr:S8 family serine peptidase [Verrucomicrobiae bacterium]